MAQTKVGYHIESTYDDKGVRAFKESVNGASKAGRGLATQTTQTSDRMARLGRESRYANSNMRMLRGGVGQLGHQVQDIAVQLQMGQNALLVFGQQGGQIASIFGPGGAVLGAVLGVGAALATAFLPRLMESKQTIEELVEEMSNLEGGLDGLSGAARDYAILTKTLEAQELARTYLEQTQRVDALTAKMYDLNYQIGEMQEAEESHAADYSRWAQLEDNLQSIKEELIQAGAAATLTEATLAGITAVLDKLHGVESLEDSLFGDDAFDFSDTGGRMLYSWDDFWSQLQARREQSHNDALLAENDYTAQLLEVEQARLSMVQSLEDAAATAREQSLNKQKQAFSTAASAMSSNAQIMQESFAETSGAAKAFFALQQAVAAATVIMNAHVTASALQKAGAEAGGIPGWLTGKAMQGVVLASGYAAAGAIAGQTVASFDGGGFTGNGPRSGGVDGKGGFPAILHPNETVVDHTRGGGAGATVHLNIYANDTKGFDDLIESRRAHITNMVRRAIESEGRRL